MTIHECTRVSCFFKKDIPNSDNTEWTSDDYQKWHPLFYELTSNFHQKVKQSYFEQTNKLIDENDFQKYYGIGTVSEFAYLGLFDEVEFSNLIRKLTNLTKLKMNLELKIY